MSDQHREPVQGLIVDASDLQCLNAAIEAALGYRGDITIARKSTGDSIEGYVFDRREGPTLESSTLRIIPADGSARVTIAYDDIASLSFSGRDTAAGKSFETWMKKYVQKKLAGKPASIESEPLDES